MPCPPPGDLPTQGSNPGLPHCRQMLSLPSEGPGKPKNTGGGSLSLLQGIFWAKESNQGLLHCRWILYQLSYLGSPHIHTYTYTYTYTYTHTHTHIDFYLLGKSWILARAECRTKVISFFPLLLTKLKFSYFHKLWIKSQNNVSYQNPVCFCTWLPDTCQIYDFLNHSPCFTVIYKGKMSICGASLNISETTLLLEGRVFFNMLTFLSVFAILYLYLVASYFYCLTNLSP